MSVGLGYFEVYSVSCPGCEHKCFLTDRAIETQEIQMNWAETRLGIQFFFLIEILHISLPQTVSYFFNAHCPLQTHRKRTDTVLFWLPGRRLREPA